MSVITADLSLPYRQQQRPSNILMSMCLLAGRKRTDILYHLPSDSSTFYSMSDLSTPPVYFCPSYLNEDPRHEVWDAFILAVGVIEDRI